MNTVWDALGLWPVRVLLAGGAVLLVGRLLMMLSRQPARRVWIGTTAVVAALLAIPLSLVPAWVHVSVPTQTVVELAGARSGSEGARVGAASRAAPGWSISDVAALRGSVPPSAPPGPPRLGGPTDAVALASASGSGYSAPPLPHDDRNWLSIVTGLYGLVVAGLMLRLAFGHLVLSELWHRAHPAPAWAESVFRRLAAPICPRARLRVSAGGCGPVCFGIVRPRVLIPASLLVNGDGPLLRAVLAHELEHLGRRDPLAGWLLGLARAAYFVCPWLAGLRREVRVAQECLADASAVAHAAGPTEYAELLIRMARSRPAPLGSAGAPGRVLNFTGE